MNDHAIKRIYIHITAVLLLLGLSPNIANAVPVSVLDTGTPVGADFPAAILSSSASGTFQYLGSAFSTSQTLVIDSMEGYLKEFNGTMTYAITGEDVSGLPDETNILFSEDLALSEFGRDWYGPSGLGWNLPAGDYWFVLLPHDGFRTSMPYGAPNPATTASSHFISGGWRFNSSNDHPGFRITGLDISVPEPVTTGLLLFGAGGLCVRRRPAH